MRLLNTNSLSLESFHARQRPPYAILSHTWGEDEVLFEDIHTKPRRKWKRKQGGYKVVESARLARRQGFDYIWIDTCCIDKSSSAELSEAINSMYLWYEESDVCYVYLSDVLVDGLPSARWFQRGWTLQELIAPVWEEFYDRHWEYIGSRKALSARIGDITSIDSSLLEREAWDGSRLDLRAYSVSQRMVWASQRQTTRVEDAAYCLMGIFDVNMPLLYGEGADAFLRLQEEILKRGGDQSILVYNIDQTPSLQSPRINNLATHPRQFANDTRVLRSTHWDKRSIRLTYGGIEVQLHLYPVVQRQPDTYVDLVIGLLDCHVEFEGTWISRPAIALYNLSGRYYLARPYGLYLVHPGREDVATRFPFKRDQLLADNSLDKLILDVSKMTDETIVIQSGLRLLKTTHAASLASPLRIKPITQTTATHYSLGPSSPSRSNSLVTLQRLKMASGTGYVVLVIIVLVAELADGRTARLDTTYPLILVVGYMPDGPTIDLIQNIYAFPARALITPDMLKAALQYNLDHDCRSTFSEFPPVILKVKNSEDIKLQNGDYFHAKVVKADWLGRKLWDLDVNICPAQPPD